MRDHASKTVKHFSFITKSYSRYDSTSGSHVPIGGRMLTWKRIVEEGASFK